MEIAVAAAIPREFESIDGGLHIEQPPFHGRGVMIDERRQIVVWARDIQGIWHGVVAGECDNTAWYESIQQPRSRHIVRDKH